MSQTVFDLQPTLVGERVTVRPLQPQDWEATFAAASDPEIWAVHPASNRYQEPVFRQFFDDAVASGSAFVFVDRERDVIFGSSRYHGLDADLREIEIGWTFMARDYWGGSYNSEVKALMLEHAFRFVGTVIFWVAEENIRSRRAMEKIGGQLRSGIVHREAGGPAPHVVYEIRKEEWQARRAG